uniref:NADH-ubiquinone oxidoreductase chain 2 n=1 Tax=Pandorites podoceroides TaxID=1842081 RepID=A0A9N7ABD0_9CRUS|nr:TPA_asm: ND2 [Pandorites podoceroides]
MLTHPANLVFLLTLFLSMLISVSANSWFMVWLGLEINLLSFIPLLTHKKNKYSSESALKYFLTQAFASMLIMICALLALNKNVSYFLLLFAFLLKAGAAPSHQWMPSMVDGLSWNMIILLMTAQKLVPLVLIFYLCKTHSMYNFISVYIVFSAIIGSIGGLNQYSLRKILTYSSISHMSWMLMSMQSKAWLWCMYFVMYSWVLISLILLLSQANAYNLSHIITLNKSYLSMILALSLMSLGGLPPFTGFVPKLMVVQDMFTNPNMILALPLLIGTFLSLFFYIRVVFTNLLLSSSSVLLYKPVKMSMSALMINLVGLLTPSVFLIYF